MFLSSNYSINDIIITIIIIIIIVKLWAYNVNFQVVTELAVKAGRDHEESSSLEQANLCHL